MNVTTIAQQIGSVITAPGPGWLIAVAFVAGLLLGWYAAVVYVVRRVARTLRPNVVPLDEARRRRVLDSTVRVTVPVLWNGGAR